MAHDWREQDRREQEALWAHHDKVTRHYDQTCTAGFLAEAEEWLASWYEAPAGFDDAMMREALSEKNGRRLAVMLRWAVDHINERDPDMAKRKAQLANHP